MKAWIVVIMVCVGPMAFAGCVEKALKTFDSKKEDKTRYLAWAFSGFDNWDKCTDEDLKEIAKAMTEVALADYGQINMGVDRVERANYFASAAYHRATAAVIKAEINRRAIEKPKK